MDEHDKRAREAMEYAWPLDKSRHEENIRRAAWAIRAAVAAERDESERLRAALREIRDGGASSLTWAQHIATLALTTPTAAASPAQAERVSEEEAGKRNADTFNLGLRTGAATAVLTERHRIATRLRARADELETGWPERSEFAASVLRAEADALEVGT